MLFSRERAFTVLRSITGVPLAAVLRQNELRDPNTSDARGVHFVPGGGRQYTVRRRGDTLASIAEAQGHDRAAALAR